MPAATLLAPELMPVPAHRAIRPDPAVGSATATASGIGAAPLDFDIATDRNAFDALEADWNELFARAGLSHQLFLSFNWLWHWCNHYLPEGNAAGPRLSVVTARRAGRLVMAWPLVRERMHGLTVLAWMGDPVSQYGDVLVEDTSEGRSLVAAGWDFIRSHITADLLRLRKVRADAVIAPLLQELGGVATETLEAPYLDLASAANYAAYEQRYSGGTRRNRKRLFRRLDEQGKVTFEEVTGGPEARELIGIAVELKRKWLVSRGLVSKAFSDDRFEKFFADVAEAAIRPAGCRVAVLRTAGRPVAIEVAVCCGERVALHIIVFDLEYEKSGAGVLMLEQSIRNAADLGARCYDLLAPGDAYKKDWADSSIAVVDWAIPMSVAGRMYARHYLGTIRTGLKRVVAAIPKDLRRQFSGALSRALTLA